MTTELSWLTGWSADLVRQTLARAQPGLAGAAIAFSGPDGDNPKWAAGSGVIGGEFFTKIAFSPITARRVWHEARVLRVLAGRPGVRVPEVVAASADPVYFITRLVAGDPLSYEFVGGATSRELDEIAGQFAAFLAGLHHPEILASVAAVEGPVGPPDPPPQATTDELRARLVPMLRPGQRQAVLRWCVWADEVLASQGDPVFVHGDLHGYNQVWDHGRHRLVLVADLETSGAAEAEYDLRYVPALGPGVDLLLAVARHYGRLSRPLDLSHVMAWHVRSFLGDAMWRTEAGLPLLLPLPGGGVPADYADTLAERLEAAGTGP